VRALLDACVLVPITLCDTLLRVAQAGGYEPRWSHLIIEEVRQAVLELRPDISPERLERRLGAMGRAFPKALVGGSLEIAAGIDVPDPDDAHVVAAAIQGRADAIVTANVSDFPIAALRVRGIDVVHPDLFLAERSGLSPKALARIVAEQAAHSRNPPREASDVLMMLAKTGISRFATLIQAEL
jgi:predicted nucleic acid-binding protein